MLATIERVSEAPARTAPQGGAFFGWVTRLVHGNRARLAGIARAEGLAAEDALDCVQEAFQTFLVLPQARQLVEEPDDAAKLLSVLTKNLARNGRRRHHRARPHDSDDATLAALPDDEATADVHVERAETYATMLGCITTLSEIQRAVVTLRLVDDVPGDDVAEQLGTTPGNVRVLLHRAKNTLRSCVD